MFGATKMGIAAGSAMLKIYLHDRGNTRIAWALTIGESVLYAFIINNNLNVIEELTRAP